MGAPKISSLSNLFVSKLAFVTPAIVYGFSRNSSRKLEPIFESYELTRTKSSVQYVTHKPAGEENQRNQKSRGTMGENVMRFDLGDLRFYENRYPAKDDLVMVKVVRLAEMGAYVSLLEYNGLEGMILMSELSKRRIRSVKKIVRVNRQEVVLVLRVDSEKGYIDLSKKRVSPEEIASCEERFSKSRRVHQIICHLAQRFRMPVEELNNLITWPLKRKYGHALDAFKDAEFSTSIINELNLTPEIKEALLADLTIRLAACTLSLRVRVDVSCYGRDGVEAVREALIAGKKAAIEAVPNSKEDSVSLKLIAPPQYLVMTQSPDKAAGECRLRAAVAAIEASIKQHVGGSARQVGDILCMGFDEGRDLGEVDDAADDDSDSDDSDSDE